MKKYLFIIIAIVLGVYLFGCQGKQASMDESQEPMSMETLSTMTTTVPVTTETKGAESGIQVTQSAAPDVKLESLPPAGPYKPAATEIQTALKNAGYYAGDIDGKIGRMTKKAIEEFQKANGLAADGKVGPKTWAILSQHLNPPPAAPKKKK